MSVSKVPPLEIRSPHGITDFSFRSREWNGVIAYHVTTHLAGRSWQNFSTNQATVAVVLEQVDGYGEPRTRINNPTPRNRYDAGHASFIPPSVDVWGYADASTSTVRDLRMRFDYRVIERLLAEEFDRKKWNEPLLLLYDDRITQCAELLATECDADGESPLYGESLMTALLAVLFTSPQTREKAVQSGLARWQLRRAVEYIEANFLEDIRLAELAGVAGLSPSHFARAFKVSMGLTPHRWLVEQRIHRAKRLMAKNGKTISVAAHLAGFANQSHFTKAFRRVTGTTPGLWLRDAV
ncbi:helix-turn-helix domain-containing protein [Edaphobacter aggregans]|uniref:helix-turn-helix domain-containing protein n=1 Tax=Edaphobacter aggregans TaxID=570835 RepID=UPI0012F768AA|nr:AraC family transcriptional regulator [Edaphobacter aggregans]